ncbi:hypothetical protein D3C87_1630030 [compost metagenome]
MCTFNSGPEFCTSIIGARSSLSVIAWRKLSRRSQVARQEARFWYALMNQLKLSCTLPNAELICISSPSSILPAK